MNVCRWAGAGALALAAVAFSGGTASAQEAAFKGGIAISSFGGDGATFWDDRLTTTLFGGHVRFRFGPIALQPELYVATKGASASSAPEEEQMRLEYLEVPVLLVVPISVGRAEPFIYGGPSISLESRCRWVQRIDGLRTNMGCEPTPRPEIFRRNALDFGVVGGGGVAYPLGPGRVMLEARRNIGLRNIARDGLEIRNRTTFVMIGYTLNWAGD